MIRDILFMNLIYRFDIYIIEIHTYLYCNYHMSITEYNIFNTYINKIHFYLNCDHWPFAWLKRKWGEKNEKKKNGMSWMFLLLWCEDKIERKEKKNVG